MSEQKQFAIHCNKCRAVVGYLQPDQGKLKLTTGQFVRFPFTIQCAPPCNQNVRWKLKPEELAKLDQLDSQASLE